jgi:hypothetical protein
MANLKSRDTGGAALSTTTIVAIVSGIGVALICAFAVLAFRLVQARRTHKKLLADLEERGVMITQAQKEARKESVSRPRDVLRRNTILPFNRTFSGWGALTSVETFRSAESTTVPAHYVPAPPTEGTKRNNRHSWPFSTRRLSGHGVQMKKIKVSRLSTVIEDPKLSPLVPILGSSHLNASRPSYASGLSSFQSLLRDHPAFRDDEHNTNVKGADDSITTRPSPRVDGSIRLTRARSVVEVPSVSPLRPQIRARSTSLCSQLSGKAPDVILPPLPLDIARIKSEAKRRSQLRLATSQLSISSVGSADTSILATRLSPVVPQLTKCGQKITKPNAKGSSIAGGRSFRDTLDLRTGVLGSRVNMPDDATPDVPPSQEVRDMETGNNGSHATDPSTQSYFPPTRAQSIVLTSMTPAYASPMGPRNSTNPKRRSKTLVSAAGSPERQCPTSTNNSRSLTGAIRSPKRQHSQTSSRSSGDNPFQWGPTPLLPSGKPSALKGSPSARQEHPRKNSMRISLVPTIHGGSSRSPSPSFAMNKEGVSANQPAGLGLGFASTRSLPTPPSSSTFAPDLKFTATSLRASLTPTSPTLPLVGYDQSYVVLPTDQILPHLSEREQKRLSNGSIFSLSRFPAAPSIIKPSDYDMPRPLSFPSSQHYDFNGSWMPETPLLQQYPFGMQTLDQDRSPSQTSMIDIDEYDPEQPSCIYQTPTNNANTRAFQSAFATIPEESSVNSQRTMDADHSRYDDSPPVSPKTLSLPRFTMNDRSAYNLPIHATTIPEEPCNTIDPSILSNYAFSMLNSSLNEGDGSIFQTQNSSRSSVAIPTTPGSGRSMFEPLLEAAFPSSPQQAAGNDSPTIGHANSEQSSSVYTQPSPSLPPTASPMELPSPVFPSSPRPGHAQLPFQTTGLSINFAEVPGLSPSPRGPRGSPPRPLRSSIAALRRMNSDAADAKKAKAGRGERRYLRLGREDSVPVPGDESWLDELDESVQELDEEECRRLIGSILYEFDEGCTVLDLDEEEEDMTMTSVSTLQPTSIEVVEMEKEEEDTTAGASSPHRSSSIWEDGEKFWTSNTPPPPPKFSFLDLSSLNKQRERYQPLASSPLATPILQAKPQTPPSKSRNRNGNRKHGFEVTKDMTPKQEDVDINNASLDLDEHSNKKRNSGSHSNSNPNVNGSGNGTSRSSRQSIAGSRYRKRSALGPVFQTPNVRIQITSPRGQIVGGMGTPGSLYDAQGFLAF